MVAASSIPERTARPSPVLVLGLIVAGWLLSFSAPARADTHGDIEVPAQLADELFKGLKFSGRIAVWPVDPAQGRQAGLTPASTALVGERIRAAIHKAGVAHGLALVEREAISKVFQEQQFSQGLKDSDFEKLAREANADAVVLVSLQRKDREEIVISARLVKSTGTSSGRILAATKTYDIAVPQNVAVAGDRPVPTALPSAPPQSAPPAAQVIPPAAAHPPAGQTVSPIVVPTYSTYTPTVVVRPAYVYPTPAYAYAYPSYPRYYYYRPAAPRVVFFAGGYRRR